MELGLRGRMINVTEYFESRIKNVKFLLRIVHLLTTSTFSTDALYETVGIVLEMPKISGKVIN